MLEKKDSPIINLTKPRLPDFIEFQTELLKIWDSKILTNNGEYHKKFEKALSEYLNFPNITLVNNATMGLMVAIKSYDISYSNIITTPFTFSATPSAIRWCGCNPIFCDIDEDTLSFSYDCFDDILVRNTVRAVVPVNIFGIPCDNDMLTNHVKRGNKHYTPIIYDSAHMFGVKKLNGDMIDFDDCMVYSFHATKLFNSIEGGCILYKDKKLKEKADLLKNFGIKNEEEIIDGGGINGKLNEIQSLVGLLNLKDVDKEISYRGELFNIYKNELSKLNDHIRLIECPTSYKRNYSYMPIILKRYDNITRNELYLYLRDNNIMVRKYFYPLCCKKEDIDKYPVAKKISENILCFPIYGELSPEKILLICDLIKKFIKMKGL